MKGWLSSIELHSSNIYNQYQLMAIETINYLIRGGEKTEKNYRMFVFLQNNFKGNGNRVNQVNLVRKILS